MGRGTPPCSETLSIKGMGYRVTHHSRHMCKSLLLAYRKLFCFQMVKQDKTYLVVRHSGGLLLLFLSPDSGACHLAVKVSSPACRTQAILSRSGPARVF